MTKTTKTDTVGPNASPRELNNLATLRGLFGQSPLRNELVSNLPLYMNRQSLMRLLFMKELYEKIVDVHGVVMEFGCKWGTNLSAFIGLRGIYEPYNHNRKIIGFDTFSGLKGMSPKDGDSRILSEGFVSTSSQYEDHLRRVLACMEQECPIAHIKKHEIVKGDVRLTLKAYLKNNPQTVIGMAYFDMDLFAPTKAALEMIMPHVTKGTVIGFDEMNWDAAPGPTLALKEVLGLSKYKIIHSRLQPIPGYIVIE